MRLQSIGASFLEQVYIRRKLLIIRFTDGKNKNKKLLTNRNNCDKISELLVKTTAMNLEN